MKKLVNDPLKVVREMLEGLAALDPDIALLEGVDVVLRRNLPASPDRQVAVISGGGAGHEPAHAGYVGVGMLHAAAVGDVFTSPSADTVLAAILAVAGPRGAVLVVKNYTGDRLNFGLAAEMARAAGIPVEIVVVADDVALRDTVPPERRRGIAGTVLVHKVAGALAESGAELARVAAEARRTAAAVGTMGVALGACTVPAVGHPGFELGEQEIELGLGIHGEQGVRRAAMQPADALVDILLDSIVADRGLAAGTQVALLVNGLGGTPPMELAVVARHAVAKLRRRGLAPVRGWSGTLLSALEMPGCSLSLLPVDDAMLALLDAPTAAPAWPKGGVVPDAIALIPPPPRIAVAGDRSKDRAGAAVFAAARAAAAALEAAEPRLTALDSAAGDGDLGLSMARGAAAVRALPGDAADAAGALTQLANALRRAIAGSSGPFYAVGLLRAARHLSASPGLNASVWAEAFAQAVHAVAELGGAKPGDRTMLDALWPAVTALQTALSGGAPPAEAWAACVAAADQGVVATATMQPRLGRASYLGDRVLGVEDGGAAAVAIWLRALQPATG